MPAAGDPCSNRLIDPRGGRNVGCRGHLVAEACAIVERPGRRRYYLEVITATRKVPEEYIVGTTTVLVCPRCGQAHGKP